MLTWNQLERIAVEGGAVTLEVFVGAAVLGTLLSLLFGILGYSRSRLLRGVSRTYVEFARGVSAVILLFWVARALPILLGIRVGDAWRLGPFALDPLIAFAIVALGINMGGYGAEVVRAGLRSVPPGQSEASISLNLSAGQRLRHVILPQAIVSMLPPYGNLNIEVLKGTSLVAIIGVIDMLGASQQLRTARVVLANSGGTAPSSVVIFLVALVLYFLLAQVIAAAFRFLERRLGGRWYGART